MITNLVKHSASLVNQGRAFVSTYLSAENGTVLMTEDSRRLIISAGFSTPLTNQAKHGV